MTKFFLLCMCSCWLHIASATDFPVAEASMYQHRELQKQNLHLLLKSAWPNAAVYHATYLPADDSTGFARLKRRSKWAKWLGIGSLGGLFLPLIGLLSIPAAIVSLVLAGQVKRDTDDKNLLYNAKTGKIFSIITLALIAAFIALIVLLVAILASRFR